VVGAYAAWTVERLRERIRLPRERGLGDLAAAVAVRTDRPLGEVARALFAARQDADDASAKEARGRAAEEEQLATLRLLRQLLSEISGKRGPTGDARPQEIRVTGSHPTTQEQSQP